MHLPATSRAHDPAHRRPGARSGPLNVTELVARYGYAIVAVMVALEGFGVPVPGEITLLTAAAFAARGHLEIAGVIAAATVGAVIGGSGGYWIGRGGGLVLTHRWGPWVGLTPARLAWARDFFLRHGAKTVIIARFVAVLRVVVGLLAGVTYMPFALFSVCNALGGALWAAAFGALGFLFGRNLRRLEHLMRAGSMGTLAVIAAGVVLLLIWRRLHARGDLPPG